MAEDNTTWGRVEFVKREMLPPIFQPGKSIPQDTQCLLWLPDPKRLDVLEDLPEFEMVEGPRVCGRLESALGAR